MASNREKLIASAQKLVEKGQYDRAIREYLKVVAEDDKDVRVWLKIGDLYVKLGRSEEAAQAYQRVAQYYNDQGVFLKAVAVYKQIIKIDPNLIDINLRLADLFKQLGLISDAKTQYQEVAAYYRRQKKEHEALEALKQMVDLEPDDVAARIQLAEEYCRAQMNSEAVAQFTRAADDLFQAKRLDDYVKVAERLLYCSPDDRVAALKLARVYLERNDTRRALGKLQVSYQAQPRDPNTLELLANTFEAMGQITKAVSVLRELGRICQEDGAFERSKNAYERILGLVPGDVAAARILGLNPGESAQPTLQPTEPPRMAPLVSAKRPASMPTEPEQGRIFSPGPTFLDETTQESTATDPDSDEEIAKILSEVDVYRKYGLHEKAFEHLGKVIARRPQYLEARERLWPLLLQLGHTDEAVEELWNIYRLAAPSGGGDHYLQELLRIRPSDTQARRLLSHDEDEDILDLDDDAMIVELESLGGVDKMVRGAGASLRDEVTSEDAPGRRSAAPSLLEEQLEASDALLQQGLLVEARAVLDKLAERYPSHPLINARLRDLEALLPMPSSPVGIESEPTSIDPSMGANKTEPERPAPFPVPHEEAAPATASGIRVMEKSVTPEDFDTHYDLGIAYKEMGFFDDAVNEFKIVMQDPAREVQCYMMIGLCLIEKPQVVEAIGQFKKGLYASNIQAQEELAIYFELGRAYELLRDNSEALYYYEKVCKRDPNFRNVGARTTFLRGDPTGPQTISPDADDIDTAFDDLVSDEKKKH